MNLAVICHSYNSFQKDSVEVIGPHFSSVEIFVRLNFFAEISRYFSIPKLNHFSSSIKIDNSQRLNNVNVYTTSIPYLPTDQGYKKLGEKHYCQVKNKIQKSGTRFNLIHSHFTWSAGYVGARLKEEYNVPFVVTAHGYDIYSLPFKDDEWREKIEYVLNTADHVITVSRSNFECMKRLDVSTPVTVIPNGFRSDLFYPRNALECRNMLVLPQDKKILLTVGNLEPVKGQLYLVEAVQKVVQERKDVLCVIVGSGKLKVALERLIRKLGLKDYILLVGGKPHEEIPLWMNACDLFVLPSLNEGNPTVMFEALGCGKPFIGTKVGGIPEIITSEDYGLLVEPADPDDLTEKILEALEKEWDSEQILKYAESFTWENISKDIFNVYKQVLG
ncbi:glycosyltransferase involved in cell wall biosynthesis [Methanomicrobium sp. W14]|uniref:glycosyltransferase family 4 protein n=1 Tax=Methanomicrobium sp. W14 TaxID=2817839 RepID=UPI001AE31939|nr:glycosyltransferase family 4 protein [Methanomicrobium sp. W14]MBP2133105.1 glycosyltransferase involved in cell wall biosynthesis [Methanomicrobium sp. W14]